MTASNSRDTEFHVVIPARYHSTRLPGKLLMSIHGQTVLERVYRQVLRAKPSSVVIATDNQEIYSRAAEWGAPVMLTDEAHQTGTDRVAEVVLRSRFAPDSIIVNVQGDEPFIPSALISQVADSLQSSDAPMATLCWPLENGEQSMNSNVVKVVRNHANQALYFSRSLIPFYRDNPTSFQHVFRHIGLYAYRASFLTEFVTWPVCELETIEALEQLRVLWAGHPIQVEVACVAPKQDVNTLDDLLQARHEAEIEPGC